MIVTELGGISGRLLVFGGVYSNLQALRALRAYADAAGIAPAQVICTGDVVAYGADPAACVDLVRDWGVTVVAGNVERQLAAGAMDCGCGFDEGSTCDRLSAGWYAHADAGCDSAARGWMATLPDFVTFRHGDRRCVVLHGGASDIARFLWPVSPEDEFAAERAVLERLCGPLDLVLAGHSGLAFTRRVGSMDWVNAGAIGMPPNDGARDTRFALLDEDGTVHLERLAYDAEAAVAAMRAAGLTQGYDRALLSGCWPSEDVLPEALRRGAGAVPASALP
ncbi:metallophosphoesterase family protein [Maliponia aquimaris]|uniref:Calcineurin-like phosphoesterase superfamily domain protein n=1 Tax=Maliponia aquimaris TaxID=1673631 RepID=A0A238JYQ3_9RHOB|nr:metallophosphoesterase family protein [Maliponia aquimaris]SMX35785.1 Calcineurin-like phosphoesterase superfamily domain protein [Maliponia aquimaris]